MIPNLPSVHSKGLSPLHTHTPITVTTSSCGSQVSPGDRGASPGGLSNGAWLRSNQEGKGKAHGSSGLDSDVAFCSRGVGLFIGVDLIKDEATRMPATEEADYLISRYFFFKQVAFAESRAPSPFHLPCTLVWASEGEGQPICVST